MLRKIKAYEEKVDKHLDSFRKFIDEKGYILDVDCDQGVFSKKFAIN